VEVVTGFHLKLAELFNIPSMPFTFYVLFNLIWIGIWIFSIFGLRSGHVFAYFAAWFLSISGILNGIIHPLLSIAAGEYFSGTVSSPFVGIASIVLWFKLKRATVRSMREVQ
jgi:hypothetical protein